MAAPSVLLNSGYDMPSYGLGTWLSAPGEVSEAIKIALANGYRHLDCAHIYKNEKEIGECLSSVFSSGSVKRKDLFITSKLWVTDFSQVKEACKLTLKNLQLEYLDLYLIHTPVELEPDLKIFPTGDGKGVVGYSADRFNEVWKDMEELVEEGLVKSIGVSNFTTYKLKEMMKRSPKIKPACNQVEMHPYLPQVKLLEYCQSEGIAVTAYSPLGNPGLPPMFVRDTHVPLLKEPVVTSIAEKHKATNAQVLIAWALAKRLTVIPKSTKESRIKENIGSLNVRLDSDDMVNLGAIKTRMRYVDMAGFKKPGQTVEDLWDGEMFG